MARTYGREIRTRIHKREDSVLGTQYVLEVHMFENDHWKTYHVGPLAGTLDQVEELRRKIKSDWRAGVDVVPLLVQGAKPLSG